MYFQLTSSQKRKCARLHQDIVIIYSTPPHETYAARPSLRYGMHDSTKGKSELSARSLQAKESSTDLCSSTRDQCPTANQENHLLRIAILRKHFVSSLAPHSRFSPPEGSISVTWRSAERSGASEQADAQLSGDWFPEEHQPKSITNVK